MTGQGFCLFDTAVGACAVVWGARGIVAVQLPEADAARTRARIARRYPGAVEHEPPAAVAEAIHAMTALIAGERRDLSAIPVDLDAASDFQRAVYAVARAIPPGETMTYGEIASQVGDAAAARAVGEAMGRNPVPIIVPCHRVLGAGGKLTGFSANGGVATKLKLLEIEGAAIGDEAPLFGDLPRAVKPARR
jgi:methylated-DNA-[protein]-cysteine S-methyltransferase